MTARRVPAALAALVLLAAACSGSTGSVFDRVSPSDASSTACAPAGAGTTALDAKAVLACVGPSIAYVETDTASGSGVLLPNGYVLTNAHVVDPYAVASLRFADGEAFDHVPVKGVDLLRDIALLGPVPAKARAATLGPATRIGKGDDVFLVGYPGETERDRPTPTIARGLLSQTREAKPFGLTYLQTDAAIGGGQSGGALVDDRGVVIGVSSLSFADRFALALSTPDVQQAIDAIVAGRGSPYRSVPDTGGVTSGRLHLDRPDIDAGLLVARGKGRDTTLRLRLDTAAKPGLLVRDVGSGDLVYVSDAARARADEWGFTLPDVAAASRVGRETAPGTFELALGAADDLEIVVVSAATATTDVSFTSSLPVFAYSDDDEGEPIRVGDSLDRRLQYVELTDTFRLDIAAGDRVTITVASPSSDMAFTVVAPGQSWNDGELVEDSDLGLFGTDARSTYRATTTGTHLIVVEGDGVSTGYRITVAKG